MFIIEFLKIKYNENIKVTHNLTTELLLPVRTILVASDRNLILISIRTGNMNLFKDSVVFCRTKSETAGS